LLGIYGSFILTNFTSRSRTSWHILCFIYITPRLYTLTHSCKFFWTHTTTLYRSW